MRLFCVHIRMFICLCFLLGVCFSFTSLVADGRENIAGAREYIIFALYERRETIEIERFNIKQSHLLPLFTEIIKDDPYLFFVGTSAGYVSAMDGKIISLYPNYTMSAEEYEVARCFCERQISSVLTLISELKSEVEIAQYIHDWLCLNFSYDESLLCDNMYLFLKEGEGTCQGYTYTYMAMLRAAGVECTFAASDSMSHIWNLVKIDGEWYHVDVTWDDYPEAFASLEYDSFLESDESIRETAHSDWYSPNDILCVSEIYSVVSFNSPLLEFAGTGDVNCDGSVDVLDLVLCELGREEAPTNTCFLSVAADIDGDGILTDTDRALIRNHILD